MHLGGQGQKGMIKNYNIEEKRKLNDVKYKRTPEEQAWIRSLPEAIKVESDEKVDTSVWDYGFMEDGTYVKSLKDCCFESKILEDRHGDFYVDNGDFYASGCRERIFTYKGKEEK